MNYFSIENPINKLIYSKIQNVIELYINEHKSLNYTNNFSISDKFNIQKYKPHGGFKTWHHEIDGFNEYPVDLRTTRILVWMINLNNVPDGGTSFLEQNITVQAMLGRIYIWPAAFTHVHKSQISTTSEKYIVTGWCNYITPS